MNNEGLENVCIGQLTVIVIICIEENFQTSFRLNSGRSTTLPNCRKSAIENFPKNPMTHVMKCIDTVRVRLSYRHYKRKT